MLSLRRLAPPALAGLLALCGLARGQEPNRLRLETQAPAANQQLADAVAGQIRTSGQLRHYRVEVLCNGGTVTLNGHVNDVQQREDAARLAQSVPGVTHVVNQLAVGHQAVTAAQYAMPMSVPAPAPMMAGGGEPMPSYASGGGAFAEPPPMPPYAWPTYAPYNNYSRVAYPQAYPYEAFPHIGPPYPFPKVPLGWRAVKLQWDDGHWWLSTHAQKRDWWVLRYW